MILIRANRNKIMTQNTQDLTKFAEMLCTRFCHDIIGPIGAVSNGAEFLREELPNMQSQAFDLIEKSSREAISRVQFYRQAYGAGLKNSSASLTEAKNTAAHFFEGTKTQLVWEDKYTDMAPVNIDYVQKKLILNLLIICSSALIRGGKITFTIDESKFEILAEGTSVKIDPDVESALKSDSSEMVLDPKLIQVNYTKVLAGEANSELKMRHASDMLAFTVVKK